MTSNLYADGRRTLVLHADDLGMSHGANVAFAELSALGACTSGSVMVPCPWFPEVAAMAAADPGLDLGVHLTLNSEKRPCRWRPLTRPPRSAGLTDEAGFFWPDVPTLRRRAEPAAVEAELRAQIDAAIAAGVDVTHLDDHMGAVMAPEFVDIYRRLGRDYDLPILLVADLEHFYPMTYAGDLSTRRYDEVVALARAAGEPVFDLVIETPWERTGDAAATYRDLFAGVPVGLTYMALHVTAPGDFEAIEPELAHIRTEEYALFRSGQPAAWLRGFGIGAVGMRAIRERLRSARLEDV